VEEVLSLRRAGNLLEVEAVLMPVAGCTGGMSWRESTSRMWSVVKIVEIVNAHIPGS
jgi:hypothetical protein